MLLMDLDGKCRFPLFFIYLFFSFFLYLYVYYLFHLISMFFVFPYNIYRVTSGSLFSSIFNHKSLLCVVMRSEERRVGKEC